MLLKTVHTYIHVCCETLLIMIDGEKDDVVTIEIMNMNDS